MGASQGEPEARELLADRGYDADWFRDALCARGITPCIPPSRSRKRPCPYDKDLYKQRHKIELKVRPVKYMGGKLSGASELKYYGTPQSNNVSSSGASTINAADEE